MGIADHQFLQREGPKGRVIALAQPMCTVGDAPSRTGFLKYHHATVVAHGIGLTEAVVAEHYMENLAVVVRVDIDQHIHR
ncbi:hypothetical protein [Cynomolgus macaque cytomegalovirus strain Mauritius]|uniref:Uncharacterized protein n=1 Tax=Cynomolgus macaque cytomegalovirus strain Mauritius TaxID=1690255 RepID=A0A0K1H092_9BETA|nr:hypothetical protein [Cynomolgus macaque cytomegalovirus strain Mauritius]AXG21838.1 hypothetical protein [synthetic construct]AXG22105.1 hypothetical protein [synthetic construct]